jgi:cytochrome c oxidase assembly protein subunit 15
MNTDARKYHPELHWFLVATAAATFVLLGSGGMVTSREAGMSVPDWPNTYGYNMFAFPVSKWIGGIFYEHTHRLLASGIGFLTTILAVWMWRKELRRWMRWLGVLAFVLVALQGVLGGLRVTLAMDKLGIVHGALAQSFFVLICALALFTSRWWNNWSFATAVPDRRPENATVADSRGKTLRTLALATTVVIFLQLILGATMRHQHAGLAIPDFPLAYGKIWPDTSADAVAHYNADRVEVISVNPITANQILLQMVHRLFAVVILMGVAVIAWKVRSSSLLESQQNADASPSPLPRGEGWGEGSVPGVYPAVSPVSRSGPPKGGTPNLLRRLAYAWLALIAAQIILGAATIWTDKAADVATAHVLVGALSLATGALWCLIAFAPAVAAASNPRREDQPSQTAAGIGAHPALAANK